LNIMDSFGKEKILIFKPAKPTGYPFATLNT